METDVFGELKAYVGFDDRDAANLRSLSGPIEPLISGIVDRFYEVLLEHSAARAVLGSDKQIARLKQAFPVWIRGLFSGCYDQDYFNARRRIGEVHVRIDLPQRFMPLAIEVVREKITRGLRAAGVADIESKLESLHKVLMLDLTIMLGSYQESYSERIRRAERHAMEGKLARAQHLAEIGQLAASLAHEIKNPLAGISGAIQIIGESFANDSPFKSIVRDILGQITRLDDTVKDLLLYARPSAPRRKRVPISNLVQRLITVLSEEPALRVVNVRFDGSPAIVSADEGQLEQILMNLVLNAAHASPPGGSIDIEAIEDNDRVALIVRDHGRGMTPDVRDRALEPFFTTKAKGTGLGLAICRRIAEAHGGSIVINSEVGRGTSVRVELPRDVENPT